MGSLSDTIIANCEKNKHFFLLVPHVKDQPVQLDLWIQTEKAFYACLLEWVVIACEFEKPCAEEWNSCLCREQMLVCMSFVGLAEADMTCSCSSNLMEHRGLFPEVCVVCWVSLQRVCWSFRTGDTERWGTVTPSDRHSRDS